MKPIYEINGLVHWSEREINARERFTRFFADEVGAFLRGQNKAWEIERVEGPIMLPMPLVNPNYTGDDLWCFMRHNADEPMMVARPETTPTTYAWMRQRIERQDGVSLPYCCWQAGKSFRNETTDAFRLSHVRLKEFYQQEFQCAYTASTMNDYQANCLEVVKAILSDATGRETRVVESDRLPSYSQRTVDIEVQYGDRWMEICSISKRMDFPCKFTYQSKKGPVESDVLVLEIAIGLDRVVAAWKGNF